MHVPWQAVSEPVSCHLKKDKISCLKLFVIEVGKYLCRLTFTLKLYVGMSASFRAAEFWPLVE